MYMFSNYGQNIMKEPTLSLDSIKLLVDLSSKEREEVARLCKWKRYPAGEQIIDRHGESRDVFFVVSGKIRIVIYSMSGREITLVDIQGGEHFGELAALDGQPRSASAMAVEDSQIASLSHEHFNRLIQNKPEVGFLALRKMAQIIRNATERIMDLSTLGANNRVHAEILRLAHEGQIKDNVSTITPIPVHGDIASRVSTTRETVARVLNDLAREKLLKRERDALLVLDVRKLEQMVEDVRGE